MPRYAEFPNHDKAFAAAKKRGSFIVLHIRGFAWFRDADDAASYLIEMRPLFPKARLLRGVGPDGRTGVTLLGTGFPGEAGH